jgi:hypothetical protein
MGKGADDGGQLHKLPARSGASSRRFIESGRARLPAGMDHLYPPWAPERTRQRGA